jgi:hypothetical protein
VYQVGIIHYEITCVIFSEVLKKSEDFPKAKNVQMWWRKREKYCWKLRQKETHESDESV